MLVRTLSAFVTCVVACGCGGALAPEASALDADGGEGNANAACIISASSYYGYCALDLDCVQVTPGDYCGNDGACLCESAAINASALAEFNADVSWTPIGSGAVHPQRCSCALQPSAPCCRSGMCTMNCVSESDALAACHAAGGSCFLSSSFACARPGPAHACLYADEVCCLPLGVSGP